MKFLTLNCNGIRSATSKGLVDLIKKEKPDLFAFQETKAPIAEIEKEHWSKLGYKAYCCIADKPGYSGVAIFTKVEPKKSDIGYGDGIFLTEGRSVLLEFSDFYFWNLYFPSGTSGEERQAIKYTFLDRVNELTKNLQKKKKPLLICGDVNIAHKEIDIHNPKGNEKNSGFLPEERKWMTDYLSNGMIDCFRILHPEKKDLYSWWTYRFQARKNNKGWRIDYFLGSKKIEPLLKSAKIITEPAVSDHAPVVVEIQFT
ncbi:exodeoxyribonuclease III [Leptospira sp. 'Mane']|uniref:exodeoxyribonuclease III n=1 Tax=Leptospira sp. 'Mane' TaxID=3387407 RepID=UPI00398B5D3D